MISATLEMQGAIVTALKASTELAAIIGDANGVPRVYDRVPEGAAFPYISLGPSQETQDDFDCILSAEVFQQVDVWSREPGFVQCKQICALVRTILHQLEVTRGLLSFEIEHRFTTEQRDGDGLTSHGILSFRALIDNE